MSTSPFSKFSNATITVSIPLTNDEITEYHDGQPEPTDLAYGVAPLPYNTDGETPQ